jgi:hypothetical protein
MQALVPTAQSRSTSGSRVHILPLHCSSWINEFCEKGGLTAILNVLEISTAEPKLAQIQLEAVTCMKAFMNNTLGLNAALESDRALNLLARSLKSHNRRVSEAMPHHSSLLWRMHLVFFFSPLVGPNSHCRNSHCRNPPSIAPARLDRR